MLTIGRGRTVLTRVVLVGNVFRDRIDRRIQQKVPSLIYSSTFYETKKITDYTDRSWTVPTIRSIRVIRG